MGELVELTGQPHKKTDSSYTKAVKDAVAFLKRELETMNNDNTYRLASPTADILNLYKVLGI